VADSRVCHACGRSNPDDARFCSGCGSALADEAPQREARKVVTALFADVVGSTALGERLDPEDLQAIVGEGVARAVRATEALGGHVERIAGDGALVIFGAPVAHEDDAERAVLAGLRLLEAIDVYSRELAEERALEGFAVRVGIETGLVVLAPVGGARPVEFTAMGDAMNTAARLEAAAEPGSMLVGPHTFDQVEWAFDWDEPVELNLKGKAEPVRAHRPRGPRAVGSRRAELGRIRLVGREQELDAGRRALDELLSGTGGILLVSGEAGLGKTRLLGELRRRLKRSSSAAGLPTWLEGRCVSYGERLPYLPFQGLLRDWLGATLEDDVTDLFDERLAGLFGERAAELRPFLGSLLGLSTGGEKSGLQPDDLQRRVFGAFAELLERLSATGPLLLAVDDVHWADAASLGLLNHLLELPGRAPVLLVLAGRPEPGHGSQQLRGAALRQRALLVELTALTREADRELLAELVGGAGLPEDLERLVLERAEGNPLYLEELVRSLVDAGALIREGDAWRFEREVEVQVPESVEKLVLSRVDLLSPDARELLSAASVLGRRFTKRLLVEIDQSGDRLDERIGELLQADLVRERRRGPETEYRFRHHLIQETTYNSVLRRRRQELHRLAAEAIERVFVERGDELLGVLAHHWRSAGELERAFEYHARAGAAAWRIVAPKEAIEQYGAALDAAEQLGMEDARVRRVRFERGRCRFFSGDVAGQDDIEAALEEARRAGDHRTEIEGLTLLSLVRHGGYRNAVALGERAVGIAGEIGDERARARSLSRLAILNANRLRLDRALDEGREALAIARSGDDEEIVGLALDGLKLAELKLGELAEVEAHCDELLALHRRRGDAFYLSFALLESAQPPLARGDLDVALARAEEALDLNRKLGDRNDEALFLDTLAWVHRARGDYSHALALGREAKARAEDAGHGEWLAWVSASLGWILLELRSAFEAANVLGAGVVAARSDEATGEELRCTAHLAWAQWLLGNRDRALALADEATRMLDDVTTPPGGAWLFGSQAQLALAQVRLESGDRAAAGEIAIPLAAAAERVGWQEVLAGANLIAAGSQTKADAAIPLLERALEAADRAGSSALGWETRLELARFSGDDRYAAEARDRVEHALAGLGDDPAAAALAAALLPAATAG
jgi:class 3 adenylate cyclase/tetratricopeptide (TPR) repeat protein